MTQAFINQTLDKAEIEELRKKLSEQDFSDCDEELLVQAAIEVEKRFNKKRKQNVSNGIVNKKNNWKINMFVIFVIRCISIKRH